jgi:hypothetical protein
MKMMARRAGAAAAQDPALRLVPADRNVEFRPGGVLHTVHGTFQLMRGEFGFDAATGKTSEELVVEAG